jgi:hypothetical protein
MGGWERVKRLAKTLQALAKDPRIPRPVRWLLVLALLPIPGPVDEIIGLVALGLIALFWRPILQEIRAQQRATPTDPPAADPAAEA